MWRKWHRRLDIILLDSLSQRNTLKGAAFALRLDWYWGHSIPLCYVFHFLLVPTLFRVYRPLHSLWVSRIELSESVKAPFLPGSLPWCPQAWSGTSTLLLCHPGIPVHSHVDEGLFVCVPFASSCKSFTKDNISFILWLPVPAWFLPHRGTQGMFNEQFGWVNNWMKMKSKEQ